MAFGYIVWRLHLNRFVNDATYTLPLNSADSRDNVVEALSTGSYLYVSAHSLLHNPRVTDEVDHKIHCAEAANTLWDVPLGDVYEKLQERSLDLNLDSCGLTHDPHLCG